MGGLCVVIALFITTTDDTGFTQVFTSSIPYLRTKKYFYYVEI